MALGLLVFLGARVLRLELLDLVLGRGHGLALSRAAATAIDLWPVRSSLLCARRSDGVGYWVAMALLACRAAFCLA